MFNLKKIELAFILGIIISMIMSSYTVFAEDCEYIRENILRLHILANSDNEVDQKIKLLVRDRILEESKSIFMLTGDKEEAKKKILENIDYIKDISEEEIYNNGYNYKVNIELLDMYFTTRDYGKIILPAGMYDSLRISIGEGKGKNWWCLIYPNMCIGSVGIEEKSPEIFSQNQEDIIHKENKIEFRFAIVEIFESFKNIIFR